MSFWNKEKQRQNEEMPEVQPIPPPVQMSDEVIELRRRVAQLSLEVGNLYEMLTRKSSVTGDTVLSATGKRLKKWVLGSPDQRFK